MKQKVTLLICLFISACSSYQLKDLASISSSEAFKRGVSSFKKNDFKTALIYFQKSKEDEAWKAQAFAAECDTYWAMGDYKKFTEVTEAHISQNALFEIEGRLRLAAAYEILGEDDNGMRVLKQIINLQPKNQEALFRQAQIYNKKNMIEEAMNSINKLIELKPNSIEALLLRANLYEKSNRVLFSLEDYKTILSFEPKNRDATFGLVRVYKARNEFDKALELTKQWILLDNNNPIAYEAKAEILHKLKRNSEAQNIYNELLGKTPNNIDYRLKLVELMMETNNIVGAKEQMGFVLKVSPWNQQANYFLGKYYIEQEEYAEAGNLYKKLYDHDPTQEWIVLSYAKLLEHINESSLSKKILTAYYDSHRFSADGKQELVVKQEPIAKKDVKPTVPVEDKDRKTASENTSKYIVVKLKEGDSLQSLSQKYFGTTKHWKAIYDLNEDELESFDDIRIGSELKIPKLID